MSGDDRDLYELFATVRREEEARVPAMAGLLRASYRRGWRRLSGRAFAMACLATTIAAAVWLLPGDRFPHHRISQSNIGPGRATASITATSITLWKPPTDFLLDTPGRALLQGVPAIGEWHGAIAPGTAPAAALDTAPGAASGAGESRRRFRKHVSP
jgi:hypothetical protein